MNRYVVKQNVQYRTNHHRKRAQANIRLFINQFSNNSIPFAVLVHVAEFLIFYLLNGVIEFERFGNFIHQIDAIAFVSFWCFVIPHHKRRLLNTYVTISSPYRLLYSSSLTYHHSEHSINYGCRHICHFFNRIHNNRRINTGRPVAQWPCADRCSALYRHR